MDRFEEHVAEREAQVYASTHTHSPHTHRIAIIAEMTGNAFFGAPPDLRNKPLGDGGIDLNALFRVWEVESWGWYHLDHKGSTYGDWLRVPVNDCRRTTIYPLVHVTSIERRIGHCVGWHFGNKLIDHCIPEFWDPSWLYVWRGPLRSMDELVARYTGVWKHSDVGLA